ncbi:MAG: helix-turn-helix domain-containing protein [Lactobacillaceae bacterium]|jgi:transcriptional regulator with XRE-family HTH domain|nr:helix-turn-helix domain-containing protein [Lactobacillaceae bacterium]
MIIKGKQLRHQREAMGLSQRALAEGICHQSLISRMESQSHVTSMVILQEICHRLQIDMESMVSFDEPNYLNLSAAREAVDNGDYSTARALLKKQCNIKFLPDEAKPLYHVLHSHLELSVKNYFGALNDLQNASVSVTSLQRNLIIEIEAIMTEVWLKLKDYEKAKYCNQVALKKVRVFDKMKHVNLDQSLMASVYRQSAQLEVQRGSLKMAEHSLEKARRYASKSTLTRELVKLNLVHGNIKAKQSETRESCQAYIKAYAAAEQLGDVVMMDDIKPLLMEQNVDYFD